MADGGERGGTVERTRPAGRHIFVCPAAELADGTAMRIRPAPGADEIAVFNDNGHYYALNDTCTHAAGSLADGWIENGVVECPLHGGAFDLGTGAALSPPVTEDATVHTVEVHDGVLWLLPRSAADERSPQ
jgi:3-phenylpropionate/trans-cinnamate dioxygenase ferredoxin subunit